jgi:hypothetical protein
VEPTDGSTPTLATLSRAARCGVTRLFLTREDTTAMAADNLALARVEVRKRLRGRTQKAVTAYALSHSRQVIGVATIPELIRRVFE